MPAADPGGRDPVRNVSFTVHRGEIVGIAGVEGNGQSELVRSLVMVDITPGVNAAKTKAILEGRPTPGPEDVRFAAYPVLRHRIVTSFNAEADGVDTMEIIKRILETVKEKA